MSRFPATCPSTPSAALFPWPRTGQTGLITVEGRVDKPSLANAMILNMNRQGWNLRGAAIGSKTMHLYEKGERYAVIYYYEQTTTAAMEIWVMTRLARRRPADHGQRRGRRRNGRRAAALPRPSI